MKSGSYMNSLVLCKISTFVIDITWFENLYGNDHNHLHTTPFTQLFEGMGPAKCNHGHLCKWCFFFFFFLGSNSAQEQCLPKPTILVVRCSFEHLALAWLAIMSKSHNLLTWLEPCYWVNCC